MRLPKAMALVCGIVLSQVRSARAACGEDCDAQYQDDVESCRSNYGHDPESAQDLADCIQTVRDDYAACLQDCAGAAD